MMVAERKKARVNRWCPMCGKRLVLVEDTTFGGGPREILRCPIHGRLVLDWLRPGVWEMRPQEET